MQWCTLRLKDASETYGEGLQNSDQASNAVWGRNGSYNEETRKLMDIRTQRQDQERTHPRNNENDTCFNKITERRLKWYCHLIRKVLRTDIHISEK